MSAAPDSLDPGVGHTTQSAEADWLAYTGLLTYAHFNGAGGTQLIPGLAISLPTVSGGGQTYTFMLRKGLVYSNGQSVRASDFRWTVERALKIPWRGPRQLIYRIRGASAYASGKAKAVAGIQTDDLTGRITIHLISAYGPFEDVLALPAFGLVPRGSPLRREDGRPPPGVGPYVLSNVVPHSSFSLVQNRYWKQLKIPRIPAGHVNIKVEISPNVERNAQAVLRDSADVFDSGELPADVLQQIKSSAVARYSAKATNSTNFVFFNAKTKPFSSQLAREAVITALDETTIAKLAPATLFSGCYLLPPDMVGHSEAPCPYGDPMAGGDLAKARALVKRSGTVGTPVTVWSEDRLPDRQWMTYYTSVLTKLGFRATLRVIGSGAKHATPGALRPQPQSELVRRTQDLPDPLNFYRPLEGALVDDDHVRSELMELGAFPAGNLGAIESLWQALDQYVAKRAYVAVLGYPTVPIFTSDRIAQRGVVLHPVFGLDWTSFKLK